MPSSPSPVILFLRQDMLLDMRKKTAAIRSMTHLPPSSGNIWASICRLIPVQSGPRLKVHATLTLRPATCCRSGESMQTKKG